MTNRSVIDLQAKLKNKLNERAHNETTTVDHAQCLLILINDDNYFVKMFVEAGFQYKCRYYYGFQWIPMLTTVKY